MALVNGDGGDDEVPVPDVVGMKERARRSRTIEDADLDAETERVNSMEPKGEVIDQDPGEGELAARAGRLS